MAKFTAGTTGTTITDKERLIREIKKNGISLGGVILFLVAAYFFYVLAVNLSHFSFSFWTGLGAPLIIAAAIVALLWASTDRTSNIVGPIITFVTVGVLIAIAILLVIFKLFDTVNFGILLLGGADFLIIVGLIALLRVCACLINKFNN